MARHSRTAFVPADTAVEDLQRRRWYPKEDISALHYSRRRLRDSALSLSDGDTRHEGASWMILPAETRPCHLQGHQEAHNRSLLQTPAFALHDAPKLLNIVHDREEEKTRTTAKRPTFIPLHKLSVDASSKSCANVLEWRHSQPTPTPGQS